MREDRPIDFLQKKKTEIKNDKTKMQKFILATLLSITMVAIIAGVSYAAIASETPNSPKGFTDRSLEPKDPDDFIQQLGSVVNEDEKKKLQEEGRINVLLLGMGGRSHEGPYLTDTIIIGSIKPETGEVAMVSVPRDLRVKVPDVGYRKINFVNAYGESQKENWGAAYTTKLIEDKFDLDINYYARIDFKAFTELVDEMGGIKVDVDQGFVDNRYPAQGDKYQTIQFKQGTQKMTGDRALKYARSRHGNNNQNSDFSRAKRQQKVILAAKKKILSYETLSDPRKIYNMMKSLNQHITTNMNLSDIISLINIGEKINLDSINTLVLDSSKDGLLDSKVINETYFLVPRSENFDKINKKIKNIFNIEGTDLSTSYDSELEPQSKYKKNEANIEIKNGTWRAGLAAKTKGRLNEEMIEVYEIGNTDKKPIKKSGIYQINEDTQSEAKKLKNNLDIPIKEQLMPGVDITSSTDLVVILGKDYQL